MSRLELNDREMSGRDLLALKQFKNIQAIINAHKNGLLDARTPDQGYPIIPVNHLLKAGRRYSVLNSFIAIIEKCPLEPNIKELRCLSNAYDASHPFTKYIKSLETIKVRQILETAYYEVVQLTIPKILFDYGDLVKHGIRRETSFGFSCRSRLYGGINQHSDKKCGSDFNLIGPHAVTLKLKEMRPELIEWEFSPASGCDCWRHTRSFDSIFIENIDADFHKTCMQLKYKKFSNFNISHLPKIMRFPHIKIMAIIAAMSGLKLSTIERCFMFGDNDLHGRLLEFYNKYWDTADGERMMADIRADIAIANILSHKESKMCANWSEDDLLYARESIQHELIFALLAPVQVKIDFICQFMSQEYTYKYNGADYLKLFDCDSREFVRKNFYPTSGESEQEALGIFYSFIESLMYKKIAPGKNRDRKIRASDLKKFKLLETMRTFCQLLLDHSGYSKHELFCELRRKGCDSLTATRVLYRPGKENNQLDSKKDKNENEEKWDDKLKGEVKPKKEDFGFIPGTLLSESSRLEQKHRDIINHGMKDIITILEYPADT